MKSNKTIWLSLIAAFILYVGFEITYGKVNFGSAFWSDTLSNRITTNKAINLRPGDSLYYNGNVVTSGSGTSIDTNKYLSIYRLDTSNIGFLNQGNSWTALNEFTSISISTNLENIGTTTLADATISGNADISGNNSTTGFTQLGNTGPYIKQKLVRGYISAVGTFLNIPHGLTDYKMIRSLAFTLLRDTTGTTQRVYHLGYNAATPLTTGTVLIADTTDIKYYPPLTATALIGDSVRVLITYEY